MNLDRDRHLTKRLERLRQVNLALVDLEALGDERLRDVGRGDRAVQRVVLADAARDLDFRLRQTLTEGLGLRLLIEIAGLCGCALALDLPLVRFGDREGHLPRQLALVPYVTD